MYHHIKKLMYTVEIGTPDPRFGNMLLEQFGGANGELAAAMQYSVQGINCEDPGCKNLVPLHFSGMVRSEMTARFISDTGFLERNRIF